MFHLHFANSNFNVVFSRTFSLTWKTWKLECCLVQLNYDNGSESCICCCITVTFKTNFSACWYQLRWPSIVSWHYIVAIQGLLPLSETEQKKWINKNKSETYLQHERAQKTFPFLTLSMVGEYQGLANNSPIGGSWLHRVQARDKQKVFNTKRK